MNVDPTVAWTVVAGLVAIRVSATVLWRDRTPHGHDPYDAAFKKLAGPVRRERCAACGRRDHGGNQAHHLAYPRDRRLTRRDLLPLCRRCHNQVTRAQGRPPWTLLPLRFAHLGVVAHHTPARLARRAGRVLFGGRS